MSQKKAKIDFSKLIPAIDAKSLDGSNTRRYWDSIKPNCMSSWYPKLLQSGVRTPRTELVHLTEPLINWFDKPDAPMTEHLDSIEAAIHKIGLPCFLRGGHTSAKHSWKDSCYLENLDDLKKHIDQIVVFGAMAADFPSDVFAVREMIPTKPLFLAFSGDLVITREFRFFADGSTITHVQPYWPHEAIKDYTKFEGWEEALTEANKISPEELSYLSEESLKVVAFFEGEWSIDWLQDVNGDWWCTDMADGPSSYRWGDSLQGKEE